MNLFLSSLILSSFVLATIAEPSIDVQQNQLRGLVTDKLASIHSNNHQRDLQLASQISSIIKQNADRVCGLIEQQFDGDVECDCIVEAKSGFIGYSCQFAEPICDRPVCGTATSSGSLNVLSLTGNSSSCFADIEGSDLDDICVDVKYNLLKFGQGGTTCRASVAGLACVSCNPFMGGASMDCSNVVENVQSVSNEILSLVNGLGLGSRRSANTIKPFLPSFAV